MSNYEFILDNTPVELITEKIGKRVEVAITEKQKSDKNLKVADFRKNQIKLEYINL